MGEKIKEVPQQIVEFWQKFSSKQKTLIISIMLAVIVTGIIFVILFTKTTYEQIVVYKTTADTAQAKTILEENQIAYRIADDGLTVSVDSKKVSDALVALGSQEVGRSSSADYSYTDALDNNLSTTNTERQEKLKLALQSRLANAMVETNDGIDAATVQVTFADNSTAILEQEKENTCAVMLTINDSFKMSGAKGLATFLATTIGDMNTDNIKIIDQDGNILFAGNNNDDGIASTATAEEYRTNLSNDIKTQVQALLLKSSNFNDVEVAPNMSVDFNQSTVTDEDYYTHEGEETGPRAYEYNYHNENNSDSGNIPGTDANDGEVTDYDITNGSNSSGNTDISKIEYNTSKRTTITKAGVATIDYDASSISIVLNRYRSYYEAEMKDELKENEQTFSEFKRLNGMSTNIDVDPALITSVAMATGISEDNISIIAYEVPLFYEADKMSFSEFARSYLQYILALLIVLLLVFVVFKGMKPIEVEEMEPELSVEALLATTKDNQSLQDIEFSDKSAARELIEKFVDENPEAVAQLLRNWLNEDWE